VLVALLFTLRAQHGANAAKHDSDHLPNQREDILRVGVLRRTDRVTYVVTNLHVAICEESGEKQVLGIQLPEAFVVPIQVIGGIRT